MWRHGEGRGRTWRCTRSLPEARDDELGAATLRQRLPLDVAPVLQLGRYVVHRRPELCGKRGAERVLGDEAVVGRGRGGGGGGEQDGVV